MLENLFQSRAVSDEYSELLSTEMMSDIATRVVFSPGETINLWDRTMDVRNVGVKVNQKEVVRGRLNIVRSVQYRARKIDTETRNDADSHSYEREMVFNPLTGIRSKRIVLPAYMKYAKSSADELVASYKVRGLVDIEPLIGINESTISEIEHIVLPTDEEENIVVPPTLIDMSDWLQKLVLDGFSDVPSEAKQIISNIVSVMYQATQQAIAFQTDFAQKIETELFNRRNSANAQGVQAIDPANLRFFTMLKKVPQDQSLTNITDRLTSGLTSPVQNGGIGSVATVGGTRCPYCTANIPTEAVKCPNCKTWIDDDAELAYNERRMKASKKKGK
jgi:hypothetical protein